MFRETMWMCRLNLLEHPKFMVDQRIVEIKHDALRSVRQLGNVNILKEPYRSHFLSADGSDCGACCRRVDEKARKIDALGKRVGGGSAAAWIDVRNEILAVICRQYLDVEQSASAKIAESLCRPLCQMKKR